MQSNFSEISMRKASYPLSPISIWAENFCADDQKTLRFCAWEVGIKIDGCKRTADLRRNPIFECRPAKLRPNRHPKFTRACRCIGTQAGSNRSKGRTAPKSHIGDAFRVNIDPFKDLFP